MLVFTRKNYELLTFLKSYEFHSELHEFDFAINESPPPCSLRPSQPSPENKKAPSHEQEMPPPAPRVSGHG